MSENSNLPTTDAMNRSNAPESPGFGSTDLKDLDIVDKDHHAVQEVGRSAMKKKTESGAAKFLSEFIYEHDKAWVREWLQNHESACIRRAKFLIRISDEYPDGWLSITKFIDEDGNTIEKTGEVDDETRVIEVPRPISQVLEAARSLGYDPTIVWDVYRDERKIITEDNGDGMTPTEFDEHFNTVFGSKSKHDTETGGMIGIGSESSAILHGEDGGMEVETRSTHPNEDGEVRPGFRAYSYLGGGNFIPGEVEDGFIGARFKIPIKGSFTIGNLQEWVEEYADKCRVPLLYREHDSGSTPVEEEYEASNFISDYDDPPVQIERPGEFSVAGGPDVIDNSWKADDNDTFLVSMPIDRNTRASIRTFWDVSIQIHDEQGRIVSGPHRGQYRDDVDELHDDDVVLPEPTGDRDRLQKDSKSKQFFNYVEKVVKREELKRAGEIAQRMHDASHPAEAIKGESSDWTLFKKMVEYHGDRRTTNTERKFKNFLDDQGAFPDFDDETAKQVYNLFQEVGHCYRGASRSTKKRNRNQKPIGEILATCDAENVFMAASTGGNFSDYFRVVEKTFDTAEVIVVKTSSRYDKWSNLFGFRVLNEVPLTYETDDEPHDFTIPKSVHNNHIDKGNSGNGGKADKVKDRALKVRTDSTNSSIDLRLSISDAQNRFEKNGRFGGHKKLVLFPRTADENISDHYGMAAYAAIASVSKTEYEELADYDHVLTYEEYTEWSKSALIATEDGAMTPKELIEDDRMVILAYRTPGRGDVVKLLADEYEQLRNYYAEDIRDHYRWANVLDGFDGGYGGNDVGSVPDSAKDDTLFAVAGSTVLSRAEWAFDQMTYTDRDISGLKLSHHKYGYDNPCDWKTLNKTTTTYRLMADTPNWDDSSEIYELMPNNRDSKVAQMYLGLHDRGIDPSDHDAPELRNLIN